MKTVNTKSVIVCGVPYEISIIDGGVLFSDKSGFYGVSARTMFEYRSGLWYIIDVKRTFDSIALCHLVKMSKLLIKHIGDNHEVTTPIGFGDDGI